ncbi:unnamed protein product [Euphydryas editha]|uniref:Uncharacterized protein n=1 Tax=Euphydryas editha TaxID=104508 RepID=A0AAU9TXR1_EUPED|nr:unnamed protein product [Euphydryas editha]
MNFIRICRGTSETTMEMSPANFKVLRQLIVAMMSTLQRQNEYIRLETDRKEMRRRRQMLFLHGIPKMKAENLPVKVSTIFA